MEEAETQGLVVAEAPPHPRTATTRRHGLKRRILGTFRTDSLGDAAFKSLAGMFGFGVAAMFLVVVLVLGTQAWPSLAAFGLRYLWSPAAGLGPNGAATYLLGTLATSLLALAIAVPVALGSAIALADVLPPWLAGPLGVLVELLAAVPSIVFGVWGYATLAPLVHALAPLQTPTGESVLTAGLVLAIMILPIVTALARDMVHAVPRSQRDAALALGATRWETSWKVVLPYARPGIVAAAILGFGRAVGETMAVLYVSGNTVTFPRGVFDPTYTMSAFVANKFGEADPGVGDAATNTIGRAQIMEMGLLLLAASLAINLVAKAIVRRLGRRMGGGARA